MVFGKRRTHKQLKWISSTGHTHTHRHTHTHTHMHTHTHTHTHTHRHTVTHTHTHTHTHTAHHHPPSPYAPTTPTKNSVAFVSRWPAELIFHCPCESQSGN